MRKIPAIIGFSAVLLSSIAFAETAPLQSNAPSEESIHAAIKEHFGDKLHLLDAKCKEKLGQENGLTGNSQKCYNALNIRKKPANAGMQALSATSTTSAGSCNCTDNLGGNGYWVDLGLFRFCDAVLVPCIK